MAFLPGAALKYWPPTTSTPDCIVQQQLLMKHLSPQRRRSPLLFEQKSPPLAFHFPTEPESQWVVGPYSGISMKAIDYVLTPHIASKPIAGLFMGMQTSSVSVFRSGFFSFFRLRLLALSFRGLESDRSLYDGSLEQSRLSRWERKRPSPKISRHCNYDSGP